MKLKALTLLFFCISLSLIAQNRMPVNVDLMVRLANLRNQGKLYETIPVLIKGDLNQIRNAVESLGGLYKYGVKDIASINLSADGILKLCDAEFVERIEAYRRPRKRLLDVALINSNIDSVNRGLGGLNRAYKGDGIAVGIIDEEIDWRHPDFKHSNGQSRISYIWDQNYDTTAQHTQATYHYGVEWDSTAFNNNTCPYTTGNFFHGTQVASIAAGNGLAANKYAGAAPNSNIIFVAVKEDSNFLTGFVDAVHYIFDKATQMGKPCAVNSSVGDYYSSHDGNDLYAQMVDNMLDASNGRFLAQAGGNARQYPYHIQMASTGTQSKHTWFNYNSTFSQIEFFGFADTANFNHLNFQFELIDSTNGNLVGQSSVYNILQNLQVSSTHADSLSSILFYDSNNQPVTLKWYASLYRGVYELWYRIQYGAQPYVWQFTTTGQGKIDIWSHPYFFGSACSNAAGVCSSSLPVRNPVHPPSDYVNADYHQTVIGYWGCSPKVLTVGAHINRAYMVNYINDTIYSTNLHDTAQHLAKFSSAGPTRDGRIKPEINACGGFMICAVPLSYAQAVRPTAPTYFSQDGYHTANGGTSMAAPLCAGTAALYFQCNPHARYDEVIQAIISRPTVDSYMAPQGPLPNNYWGYGKLNGMSALRYCRAVGVENIPNSSKDQFILEPNPTAQNCKLEYNFTKETDTNAIFELTNITGQRIYQFELTNISGTVNIPMENLPKGMYIWTIQQDGRVSGNGKLIKN